MNYRVILLSAFLVFGITHSAWALPEPVDRALLEAEANSKLRVSFTLEFKESGKTVLLERFDAQTKKWTVQQGARQNLSKEALKFYKKYCKFESAPGGLVYADYRDSLGDVSVFAEEEARTLYAISPDSLPENVIENREDALAVVAIDKADNIMSLFKIRLNKPMKFNAFTEFQEFEFVQIFDRKIKNAPPLMTKFIYRAKGKKGFSQVDDDFEMLFSDFTLTE